jgi:large subunit ribosomal protein L10
MVSTAKKKTVDGLVKEIQSAKTTAVVGITNIPSKQFQQIRKKLKGDIKLRIVKNSLILRALEKAGVKGLAEHVSGPGGLVMTSLNTFKLSKLINSCKIKAPAKAGSISPSDIIVPKGDTPFPAGPIIGDVQKAGIKAKIQGGKIVVTEESLVVKAGQMVPAEAAGILARLGITPMEIGLDLRAAFEDGVAYSGDILNMNDDVLKAKIAQAYRNAFNLAFNADIYTKDTIKLQLQNAHLKAMSLSYNAEIVNKETVSYFLAKANAEAKALSALIPEKTAE